MAYEMWRSKPHPARPVSGPDGPECRVCGHRVESNPNGGWLHDGEPVSHRVIRHAPADRLVIERTVELGARAIADVPTVADPEDLARAVIDALYAAGHLRRRPQRPRVAV